MLSERIPLQLLFPYCPVHKIINLVLGAGDHDILAPVNDKKRPVERRRFFNINFLAGIAYGL